MVENGEETSGNVSSPENVRPSYVSRPRSTPWDSRTVGQLLGEAEKKFGPCEFICDVTEGRRLTFTQVKEEVDNLAAGLLKIPGVSVGDRLAILGKNNWQWIVTYLAAAKAGLVIVPLNPVVQPKELLYALNHVTVKIIAITGESKKQNYYDVLGQTVHEILELRGNSGQLLKSSAVPSLTTVVSLDDKSPGEGLWTLAELQTIGNAQENLGHVASKIQFDDILQLSFTSGTAGQQKGVTVSHQILANATWILGTPNELTCNDRHLVAPPLCHMFGILVGIWYPLHFGCCAVLPSPLFSATAAITTGAAEKCTWIHGTPTMHIDMMNYPEFDQLDLTRVRGAFCAGAPSPKTLFSEMMLKYGIEKVYTAYGSTEMMPVTMSKVNDSPELSFTTVGYPADGLEMKIVDRQGRIVPWGVVGEVCVRWPLIMQGYWNDPEKTKQAIDSARWYHSGDAGFFHESGHLTIAGRYADMLIRGGANIYPKEIEDFLQSLEKVQEVAVFGVPDKRLGEVVAAWIVPKSGVTLTPQEVTDFCQNQISRPKTPVYIKIIESTNDFPKTTSGKVQKTVLTRIYSEELGVAFQ